MGVQELQDQLRGAEERTRQEVARSRDQSLAEVQRLRDEVLALREEIKVMQEVKEANFDKVVENVSKRITAQFYQQVGESFVKRSLTVIGVVVVVMLVWLTATGKIKLGAP